MREPPSSKGKKNSGLARGAANAAAILHALPYLGHAVHVTLRDKG